MTKGGALLTTIFNVVVNTVVRHWESLVAEGSRGGISDNNEVEHPVGRTFRAVNNG